MIRLLYQATFNWQSIYNKGQLAPFFVKRFLIPLLTALSIPAAANAFPFGGDIVEKTDIGEKYKVKKSTVKKNFWLLE